jgi:hypothetical protein
MKTSISLFVTALTLILAGLAVAENSLPPGGPYRSINKIDQFNLPQNKTPELRPDQGNKYTPSQAGQLNNGFQNPYIDDAPEWVKQRQAEMNKLIKQNNSRVQAGSGVQDSTQPEIPEWVKQRQAQMQQWVKQQPNVPPRNWRKQAPPQWNQNRDPFMRNPNQAPVSPNNRMYFPSARGPVFGPGTVPPGFNNHPGNRNAYPPAWR